MKKETFQDILSSIADETPDVAPINLGSKQCARCKQVKPLDQFSPTNRTKDKRKSICKVCKNAEDKARYHANKKKR